MVEDVFHCRCHKKLHINAAIPMPVKNIMKITNAIFLNNPALPKPQAPATCPQPPHVLNQIRS
jgi:hypothetical protein